MSRTVRQRLPLEEIAAKLAGLDSKGMTHILEKRLVRLPIDPLPPLHRDEDPTDVLVDSFHWLQGKNTKLWALQEACGTLAEAWASFDEERIRTRPEPVGELHYLCARIGALQAVQGIARVVARRELNGILLPGGEDFQLRSLRALVGLLAVAGNEARKGYRVFLDNCLEIPQYRLTAVTALVAFWPNARKETVERLQASKTANVDAILKQAERNAELIALR